MVTVTGQAAVFARVGGGDAAVDGGDGRDDGQAESGAIVRGAIVEPLERLEDALRIRLADSRAGVGHGQPVDLLMDGEPCSLPARMSSARMRCSEWSTAGRMSAAMVRRSPGVLSGLSSTTSMVARMQQVRQGEVAMVLRALKLKVRVALGKNAIIGIGVQAPAAGRG